MNKCHIYIDGTWLFKQCGKGGILTKATCEQVFFLDFTKLKNLIMHTIADQVSPGSFWYFTSIIENVPQSDSEGNSLQSLSNTSVAKTKTVSSARYAGFDTSGVFRVPFRPWMPKRINDGTFEEKLVDTSLVARMVLSCITNPNDYHVLISGDLDMMAAVSIVVPDYLQKVILFTAHPDQWDPNMQQTSKKLHDFIFSSGPYYLENYADQLMSLLTDQNLYTCTQCKLPYITHQVVPQGTNAFCTNCQQSRPLRRR